MSKKILQVIIICTSYMATDGARNMLHAQNEVDCHQLLMACVGQEGCASFKDADTDASNTCGQELYSQSPTENPTLNRDKLEHACKLGCGVLHSKQLCTITDCLGNQAPWQQYREQPLLPSINKTYRGN